MTLKQAHLEHVWAMHDSLTQWLPALWNVTDFALIKDTYRHLSHLDEVKCCNSRLKQAENYCWDQMEFKKKKERKK